jgi:hypothetical protein
VLERAFMEVPGLRYFVDYTLQKDTVIDGKTYSLVIGSDTADFNMGTDTYRLGYTRMLDKRVYFKPTA